MGMMTLPRGLLVLLDSLCKIWFRVTALYFYPEVTTGIDFCFAMNLDDSVFGVAGFS